MRTNIVIDDKIMNEAIEASGITTKRAVVEEALKLLIRLRKQAKIRKLKGRLVWEGNLDEMRTD